MQINNDEIHVWIADLTASLEDENTMLATLNKEERARAMRFHFAIHQKRFIVTRYVLRQLLGEYLNIKPHDISFAYNEFKKPYLATENPLSLQFNLSHSEDRALYAFSLSDSIGIDVEKTRETYSEGVLKHYFSSQENEALQKLEGDEQVTGFYRMWSRKEALIKALGKGFFFPSTHFSVSAFDIIETLFLENKIWALIPLATSPGYQAALATTKLSHKIIQRNFSDLYFMEAS